MELAKRMSEQNSVKISADGIASSIKAATKGKGLPPVHLWNPPFCGDLDIRIARDGTWFYLGTPIGRVELVRLFSSILKIENGKYFLVTPVEKVGIRVDDAPFVAVDFTCEGKGPDQVLTFETNVGDKSIAGPENKISVSRDPISGEPSPYVHIRADLWALIDRKSFYRLVDIGTTSVIDDVEWFGVWSSGEFFAIIPAAELVV